MRWQDWSKRILWRLKSAGLSDNASAACLSQLFHEPIEASDISATWEAMVKEDWHKRPRRLRSDYDTSATSERLDNVVSCLLHHLDLRRAGHHPSKTEYTVERESAPRRVRPTAELRSFIGSSASSCSDWGG